MSNLHTIFHQINLHKSKYANYELFKQVETLNNFVALTQEPHIYKGKLTGLPRGLRSHLVGPNPRSCIIWPQKLNITPVTDFCTGDVVSCLWETDSIMRTKIILISAYWDILLEEVPVKLVACIEYCISHNIPYLCSMDTNAHSSLWGCSSDNPRGQTLEEFIIRAGADILNSGTHPTFSNHRYSSIIDITLSDPSLSPSLSNWRIHDTPSLSDHVAIRVDLNLTPPPPLPTRVWKTADWPLFQSLLHNLPPLPSLWNEVSIDTQCNLLHESINLALDTACPKLLIKPVHKLPWWDFSLDKSRRNAHRTHNHYRKNPTDYNHTLFKRARRSHQRQCRKAKRVSWKHFVSGSNSQKNAALLSKIVQHKINTNSIGYLKLPDGSTTTSIGASLEALVDQHFPDNSTQGPPHPFPLSLLGPLLTSPGLMINSSPKLFTLSNMTKLLGLMISNPLYYKTFPPHSFLD